MNKVLAKDHMTYALDMKHNYVYSWGVNEGRGLGGSRFVLKKSHKEPPIECTFFGNREITDFSIGSTHCAFLSREAENANQFNLLSAQY